MVLHVPLQVAIRTHVLVHADIQVLTARLIPVHAQMPHVRTEVAALLLDATRIRAHARVVTQEQIARPLQAHARIIHVSTEDHV